jgi:hypothetical protein
MFRSRNSSFDSHYYDNRENDYDNEYEYDSEDPYHNYEYKKSTSQNSKYNESFNNIYIDMDIEYFDINLKEILKDININLLDNKINEKDLPKIENENIFQLNEIIENKKIVFFENRHEYLSKKKIIILILNSGGIIYGGCLRDCIRHDFGAKLYYHFTSDTCRVLDNLLYCDKDIHTLSYEDRNTIFNDIDTIMNMSVFKKFLLILDDLDIKYEYYIFNDFKKYIDLFDDKNQISKYIILKIKIDNLFDINNLKNYSSFYQNPNINVSFRSYKSCTIKIDILICQENISIKKVVEDMTLNSDFYCNSLFIFNNKLHINKEIAKNLKESSFESLYEDEIKRNIDIFLKEKLYNSEVINIVKKQIIEKKAIELNLSKKSDLRINKIKEKGFKIIAKQDIYEFIHCKDELCLLCRSEISEEIEIVKYKCCNSYFHQECLVEYIKKKEINKCFICSKSIDPIKLKML